MSKNRYFSHDSNARNSDRLIPLRAKLGARGYAIYFMILERLREEPDYTSARDYEMLAFDFRVEAEEVREVVENFDLFSLSDDGKRFYSVSFLARMRDKDAKSEKMRLAAAARWHKDAEAMQKQCKSNAKADTSTEKEKRKSTQKEIKKEIEPNKTKESLSYSPSFKGDAVREIDELLAQQREKIFSIFFFKNFIRPEQEVENFINHYAANGWRRSGGIAIKTAEQLLACARQWRSKDDKPRFDENLLVRYRKLYDAMEGEMTRRLLLRGLVGLNWSDLSQSKIEIRCTKELHDLLIPIGIDVAVAMGYGVRIILTKN